MQLQKNKKVMRRSTTLVQSRDNTALPKLNIKKNVLLVQNPRYKCDLGNKNDWVTEITADYIWLLQ